MSRASPSLALTPDGHSYVPSLLRPGGWALDVGCRGFAFTDCMTGHGLSVLALEADPAACADAPTDVAVRHQALVGSTAARASGSVLLYRGDAPEKFTVVRGDAGSAVRVPCTSIERLMADEGIAFFEIVKLDCEGAEYAILDDWPGPIARQLTVEFHDFLGFNPEPRPEAYYARLFARLSRWYDPVKHVKEAVAWLAEPAYLDSLFVLR